MDAVVLAAGMGTRLRPHTLTTPKPLLKLQGRPILDWALAALPRSVNRVLIVVHYLADQIDSYLHQQTWFAAWESVRQPEPRGTGDALRSCLPRLRSERILVVNGDDLFGAADLAALVRCPAGLLVQSVPDPRRFGIAFLRQDGSLERLVEKPELTGPRLANTGAYILPRSALDLELPMSPRGEYELTDYVTAQAASGRVDVIEAKFWLPMSTIDAWQAAQTRDLSALERRF